VEVINSGKQIKIDAIDTFDGTDGTARPAWSDYNKTWQQPDIWDSFRNNLAPAGSIVEPIRSLSHLAATRYQDASLDFVFLDACHQYEQVKQDILAYLPKVKSGGFIGGHDYNKGSYPGVVRAVNEHFKSFQIMRESWLVKV
jgi:hypothetical protein